MTAIWDGPWRLVEHDPLTDRTLWVLHQDGQIIFRSDYPVNALIEQNSMARANSAGNQRGDFSRIASLPLNLFHHSGLAEALLQNDRAFISRFLNDGDNAAWRTREGKV